MKTHVREISEVAPKEQWYLAPKSTSSLRYLDAKLSELESAVDGADAAPTAEARASWAKLKPMAEATLKRWSELGGR